MFSISHELRDFVTENTFVCMSSGKLADRLFEIADRIDREHEACVSHLQHDKMPLISVIPDETILTVHTFQMGNGKEPAWKVLEEAAEAYNAWAIVDDAMNGPERDEFTEAYVDSEKEYLADEIADCIQACCNLADRYDIDLQAAMSRCEERNRERGRYK